jgi:hypothetical protein
MGLLASFLVLISSAACYAPELRDCTVKCGAASDCATDQICHAGYCVGSSEVDCSTSSATTDAGRSSGVGNHSDAGNQVVMMDAAADAPPADPPTLGSLVTRVDGKGTVLIQGIGLCSSSQQPCTFGVPLATSLTAYAVAGSDFRFDRWTTSSVCPDTASSSCSFMPQLTIEIGAKFRKDN